MLKRIVKSQKITIITVQQWVREQQSTSTIIFHIFALAQHYWLHSQNCPSLKLTLRYCVTYDTTFTDVFSDSQYFTELESITIVICGLSVMSDDHNYFQDEESECLTAFSEEIALTSASAHIIPIAKHWNKHTLHPQLHTVLVRITQCNAPLHGTTSENRLRYM